MEVSLKFDNNALIDYVILFFTRFEESVVVVPESQIKFCNRVGFFNTEQIGISRVFRNH